MVVVVMVDQVLVHTFLVVLLGQILDEIPLDVVRVDREESQDEMHQVVEIRVDHCPDWLTRQEMTHHCDSYQAARLASEIPF